MHEVYYDTCKISSISHRLHEFLGKYSNQNEDIDDLAGHSCHGGHQGHINKFQVHLMLKQVMKSFELVQHIVVYLILWLVDFFLNPSIPFIALIEIANSWKYKS